MKNIKIAVIPIAGLGTRFLPFTKVVAKEMLPILNRPTLSYIVDEAIESGIEEIVFVTSDSKQQVLDYFSRNEKLEEELIKRGKEEQANLIRHILPAHIKLTVVYQKEQLGLGHAVLQAKEVVGDQTFALLLGDDVMYSDKQPVLKQMIDKSIELDASILGVQQVE
ncbi:MAG: hypothetical protein DRP42_05540 [Tenericutes bacterium]|nr:MAG: hypothetical protein DRP42_05540 [Mycoplasmatota bacterium]